MTRRVGSHNGMKDSSLRRRSQRTETSGFEKITSMETEVAKNYGRSSVRSVTDEPGAKIIEDSGSALVE